MTDPNTLNPDFTATEHLNNEQALQTLIIQHRTVDSYAFLEAFKFPDKESGYYSFGWRARQIFSFMALPLLDSMAMRTDFPDTEGDLTVVFGDEERKYRWVAQEQQVTEEDWQNWETQPLEDFDLPDDSIIQLKTDTAAIVWEGDGVVYPFPNLGIVTAAPIDSRWLQETYEASVDPITNLVVCRNIGGLVAAFETYLETPFGECSLETGFTDISDAVG